MILLISVLLLAVVPDLSISSTQAEKLAERIWENECNRSYIGLTSWNPGEEHASLGIGHFIWSPQGKKSIFEETFPQLVMFMETKGVKVPAWLKKGCPWKCEEEFWAKLDSKEMKELRGFLFETRTYQAEFIAKRLEKSLDKMCVNLTHAEKERLTANFSDLAQTESGLYALIDYLNFKGDGTSPTEQYQEKGWGLKHVLLQMKKSESSSPLSAFTKAAQELLTERVKNAPKEKNEERWLKGWMKRLESYTQTT
ncbi:MAG: hypothetical protein ACHQT8_05785 [Chlamydiales bacterium]